MSAMKLERKAAEKAVSSDGASASVMIKLQLLPEHLGADVAFLSCFPGESEYLYGPGTYIEPKPERGGARMPGAVKVVEGQIHIKEHPVFSKHTAEQIDEPLSAAAGGNAAAVMKPAK